jgi:predicted RNA-binding protein associated with RNAse of E/G family
MTAATILEVKEKLSGEQHEFASDLLALGEGEAVSLYTLPRDGQLGGVELAAGTRCLGHFWATRPYNVYHAVDADGRAIVYYINLSDRTVITPEVIHWRDLIVDVVITSDGECLVLDEDELPDDLEPALLAMIEAARDDLVRDHPALVAELEERAASLLG